MAPLLKTAFLAVVLSALPSILPNRVHAEPLDAKAVDSLIEDTLKAWKCPGVAVAIVRGDEVVYLRGHGVKEFGSQQPVTPDTLFAIGSCTKAFTTTAIAMLVDDGKMAWDDPVRKYIEFFRLSDPLADRDVTLRDTVTHRTGLDRHDLLWYGSSLDREEIIRRMGLVKLAKPFRSTWQYQNIMYLTAGYASGKAAGGTWEDVVGKRILEPLGMTGANFHVALTQHAADHATPHRKAKEDKIEVIPWRNLDNIGPAGSINAGVRDMSKWLRFQLGDGTFEGKRLLSKAKLEETHTPQMVIPMEGLARLNNPDTTQMSYGLGWVIHDDAGRKVVSHGGGIDGFRAGVVLLPKEKLGIVILSNLGDTLLPEALGKSLLDLVLDRPKKDWNAVLQGSSKKLEAAVKGVLKGREAKRHKDTKPSRDLAAYTGAYEDPAYGRASLTLVNGKLLLEWSFLKLNLDHFHFDTFTTKVGADLQGGSDYENQPVVFTLDADGDVATMTVLGAEFKKVKAKPQPQPKA
jgi:CubicO group peptidase (beta-lactamase class C family)